MIANDLLEAGLIKPEQAKLLELQRDRLLRSGIRRSLNDLAIENRFVRASQIQEGAHGLNLELIDIRVAQDLKVMPLHIRDNILTVKCARRLNSKETDELVSSAKRTNGTLKDVVLMSGDIDEIMAWLKKRQSINQHDLADKVESLNSEPNNPMLIQSVLEGLYNLAIVRGASDIHLRKDNKSQGQNFIEFRIDGRLRTLFILSLDAMAAVFARVKGLANLDISNSFVPQDGRTQMEFKGRRIDMRVATIPMIDGEKITIRMLDPDNLLNLDEMFHPYPELLENVRRLTEIHAGLGGMVIVSGPTGSGKTTTNYAFIREIDRIGLNVMSAEDPVEYEMPLMVQSQVRPEAGVDFPQLLRAQLRNDPDVMLVGEMRDSETAEIAVRSADTGHAIFTTLHTDDAISTVNRFISMLSPSFSVIGRKAIANNLKAIINQRLARKLCLCATEESLDQIQASHKDYFDITSDKIKVPAGCSVCEDTGYKGRVLVPEALFFKSKKISGPEVAEAIESGNMTKEFVEASDGVVYFSLKWTCGKLLSQGLIDLEEAKRIMGLN